MSDKHDILDVLKNFEDEPWQGDLTPQWEGVVAQLDKKKRKGVIWWISVPAAIALIALVVGLSINNVSSNKIIVDETIETPERNLQEPSPVIPEIEEDLTKTEDKEINDNIAESVESLPSPRVITPPNDLPEELRMVWKPLEGLSNKGLTGIDWFYKFSGPGAGDLIMSEPDLPKKKKQQPRSKIEAAPELYAFASPGWMLRDLKANPASEMLHRSFLQKVDGKVNGSAGMQYGIGFRVPVYKNLSASFGVGVTQFSESVAFDHLIEWDPVRDPIRDRISGYTPRIPDDIERVKYSGVNTYQFIEIPMSLSYQQGLGRSKWSIRPEAGVSITLAPAQQGKEVDPTVLQLVDLNSAIITRQSFAFRSSLAMRYQTRGPISIEVAPFYNRMMRSFYLEDYPVENKPYIYGINVGLQYRLNK